MQKRGGKASSTLLLGPLRLTQPCVEEVIKMTTSYAQFLEPGAIDGMDDDDAEAVIMLKGKTKEWCGLAKGWAKTEIPAIVFLDVSIDSPPIYLLCDGHHRLAYANAKSLETIDVIILRRRQ